MASEPLKASNSLCFTQWDAYKSRKSPTDSAEEALSLDDSPLVAVGCPGVVEAAYNVSPRALSAFPGRSQPLPCRE
jgi:hypothetical protein